MEESMLQFDGGEADVDVEGLNENVDNYFESFKTCFGCGFKKDYINQ